MGGTLCGAEAKMIVVLGGQIRSQVPNGLQRKFADKYGRKPQMVLCNFWVLLTGKLDPQRYILLTFDWPSATAQDTNVKNIFLNWKTQKI